jgi:phosphocarrier protein FPr/phosphocarrier protein
VTSLILSSPLRGYALDLEEVPDPVFAQKMLGDGVAVDPTGDCLHAPCDGIIVSVHASRHAVTLRADEGAEILMHIGIDTVAMGGTGFRVHVAEGQRVLRGDPLVSFDLALLLPKAHAVVTPILLTNSEQFRISRRDTGKAVSVGEALFFIEPLDAVMAGVAQAHGEVCSLDVIVPMTHGIHARPAARIAECARAFVADATLAKGDKSGSARSPVAMLALGVRCQDTITVRTQGPDAPEALRALVDLISSGMGESAGHTPPVAPVPVAPTLPDGWLGGVVAAPGLAIGRVHWLRHVEREIAQFASDPAAEAARLEAALSALTQRLSARSQGEQASIAEAHLALLNDPDLRVATDASLASGHSADFAWRAAMRTQAEAMRATGDRRLAERADDFLDLERQILSLLAGEEPDAPLNLPEDTVLLAEDLLPSHVMALDLAKVRGFATLRGGPTSHVAILAGGMGLPALVAMGEGLRALEDGALVILDASGGAINPAPDAGALDKAHAAMAAEAVRRAQALAAAGELARTACGVRIEAFANLGSRQDAEAAVANGAEGSGLLRTEFLFLESHAAPDEDQQAAQYQAIADAMQGRPVIVRLMDIGGDKPAPFLPMAPEENPALGLRGIRVGLDRPDLLRTQLRAILKVHPLGQCRIMVPMIASLAELREVRRHLNEVRAEMGVQDTIPLGIMVETPAAAVTADLLAQEADFLSVGSNDLTQYTLAMDRGNPAVAAGIDGLHPAILRLIAQACQGAARHGRWVGVCGGLASDPLAVPILLGLGVTELSSTPAQVPAIKAAIRAVTLAQCRELADGVLALADAAQVRALARSFQEKLA